MRLVISASKGTSSAKLYTTEVLMPGIGVPFEVYILKRQIDGEYGHREESGFFTSKDGWEAFERVRTSSSLKYDTEQEPHHE